MTRLWLAFAFAGCAIPPCPAADLSAPPVPPTFAVVSSDYSSTAIALLDADGTLITEAWLDSGTTPPGITAALSGDVSLPSSPFDPCVVPVIDRYGTDVVSFLDSCAGGVRRQVEVGVSFSANPRDVLRLGESEAWVTRHGVNPRVEVDDPARGNDVLVIDWESGRVLSRIDLSVADEGGRFALPDRMMLVQGAGLTRVIVGLARLSADFREPGPGAIASIDPETRAVSVHLLDGLTNCGEIDVIEERVVVTCVGPTYVVTDEERRPMAGLVALELGTDGTLHEVAAWRAAEHPSAPVPSGPTIPLSPDRWLTTARGDLLADVPDRVLLFESGAEPEPFLGVEAPAFSIGDGVYDPTHDLLLLPDASIGAVRRFAIDRAEELEPVDTAGCRGLPPREVRAVRELR